MTAPSFPTGTASDSGDGQQRALAIKRLQAKQAFRIHLLVYLAINALLIAIWAGLGNSVSIPGLPPTFFWPIFPILGWGLGLAIQGYMAYYGGGPTEDEIQREMKNLPR
jgi:2TM domain